MIEPQVTPWEQVLQPQPDGRVILELHTVLGRLIFQCENPDKADAFGDAWHEAARIARTGLMTPRAPLFLPNGQPHVPGAPN